MVREFGFVALRFCACGSFVRFAGFVIVLVGCHLFCHGPVRFLAFSSLCFAVCRSALSGGFLFSLFFGFAFCLLLFWLGVWALLLLLMQRGFFSVLLVWCVVSCSVGVCYVSVLCAVFYFGRLFCCGYAGLRLPCILAFALCLLFLRCGVFVLLLRFRLFIFVVLCVRLFGWPRILVGVLFFWLARCPSAVVFLC